MSDYWYEGWEAHDLVPVIRDLKVEIDSLRSRLAAAVRRSEWMLHNGGLWCDEWPKEWMPSKHGPLIPWLSARIDAHLAGAGEAT